MVRITLFNAVTLDDAAEGPFGLRVWPSEALELTVKGYRERIMRENGCTVRPDGTLSPYNRHTASHHRGRPKGTKEFKEGINQTGNRGKR